MKKSKNDKMKVIGIGLHKTGTTTLGKALEIRLKKNLKKIFSEKFFGERKSLNFRTQRFFSAVFTLIVLIMLISRKAIFQL